MNEDEQLWKRLHKGDKAAFEQVVGQHYLSVYRQLCYLTNDDDCAADLTQETFLQAWKSLRSFGNKSRIRTWLHTIATRVWWSSKKRVIDEPMEAVPDSLPALDVEPLTAALAAAEWAVVACAVRRLPDLYRAVIVLHYLQEMTQPEIAQALNIPVGTVKSRLHEAIRRLRRSIANLEGEQNAA